MPNELVRNTIYKYGIIIIILRSASETKEEVFSMLKKSVAIGFALPEEDGDLRSFHFRVIELTVSSRRDGAGSGYKRDCSFEGRNPHRNSGKVNNSQVPFDDY